MTIIDERGRLFGRFNLIDAGLVKQGGPFHVLTIQNYR